VKFVGSPDGGAICTFEGAEVEVLRQVPDLLRSRYLPDSPEALDRVDPVRDRLFPRAYLDPTEDRAEDDWRAAVHPEILRDRLDGLDRLVAGLDGGEAKGRRWRVTLGPADVDVWIQVLNDARLTLGTLLGVTDESDFTRIDPADPQAAEQAVYAWLSGLQGALVETMLATLPLDGTDD